MTKEFTEVFLVVRIDGDSERLMLLPGDLEKGNPGIIPFIPKHSGDPEPITDEVLQGGAADIAKATGETIKIIRFTRQDIVAHGWPGTVH